MIEPGWTCPIPGRRCVPFCGDGLIVGPETCDDRNALAGDGCSDICLIEPSAAVCGNGVMEGAEQCDDGPSNRDSAYGGCTPACRLGGYCGDGIVNGSEQCDEGDRMNVATYGNMTGCAPGCRFPHYCGDAIVDESEGEQCDFGDMNGMASSYCSSWCKIYIQ
jgi:cysteine-rich repeat protein